MKKLIVFSTLLISSSAFATSFKTVAQAEAKLAAYTVEDIKGDEQRFAEGKSLKIDEIFDDLTEITTLTEKNKISEELAVQIERVCLLASLRDKSNYAIDLVLPIYQKNKSLFKKGLQRFHSADQKELKEVLEGKDRETIEGNG